MQVTFTKVQDAQPLGDYLQTIIDKRKEEADIRILSVEDGKFVLDSKVPLSGRGVKQPFSNDLYEVTRKALEKIQAQYNVVTDF